MVKNPSPVPTHRLEKVENKNAKRKMRQKCNAKGKRNFTERKQKTWKRHKEFVLINKKSFTFLSRKLRGKYVKK
jgi:hypothetical protein